MTQSRRGQGEYMTTPSRFIEDVPEDVLEPVRLVEEDAVDEDAVDEGAVDEADAPASPPQTEDAASTGNERPKDGASSPPDDPTDADGLPF
mgnify:FL=1